MDYKIIDCPDCRHTGKKQQEWVGLGIMNDGEVMYTSLKEDCPRCKGLGSLKVKIEDIQEA